MKATLVAVFGCMILLSGGYAIAACGSCQGNNCNPYETSCQCTDPACNNPWDTNCISRAECCEAFGNVGAR